MSRAARSHGFTLLEMMVVLAIILVLAMLVFFTFGRQSTQVQKLVNVELDMRGLLTGARQTALASGYPVAVLVYPQVQGSDGVGRLVVYQDGDNDFFQVGAALNFESFDPQSLRGNGSKGEVLTTLELPVNLVIGPGRATGLPNPFAGIGVGDGCPFCQFATSHDGPAGAIVFDPSGRASFRAGNGAPLGYPFDRFGGSITVTAPSTGAATTVAVAAFTGAVQVFANH